MDVVRIIEEMETELEANAHAMDIVTRKAKELVKKSGESKKHSVLAVIINGEMG